MARNDRRYLGACEGLRHVVIGSGQLPSIDLEMGRKDAHEDHRKVRQMGLATNPPTEFDTTETTHLHVKQSHVRPHAMKHFKSFPSIFNLYRCKARETHSHNEHFADFRIMMRDQR